jgi:hypothetical protein
MMFYFFVGYCEQIQIKTAHEVNTITGEISHIAITSFLLGFNESNTWFASE